MSLMRVWKNVIQTKLDSNVVYYLKNNSCVPTITKAI